MQTRLQRGAGKPTALPVGCAERCMAGGSVDRQGGGSGFSPARDAEHSSRDAHGVERLGESRRVIRNPEEAAESWERGWWGS